MLASVVADEDHADRPVAVWLEDRDGTIVRGVAESVTAGGARVRLPGELDLDEGEGVALRICFEPDSPTVAATARVSWIRSGGGQTECALEWTAA
jgi:hypothetical protein